MRQSGQGFRWRWRSAPDLGCRGAAAVWVALSLLPTLTLIALALDVGQGELAKIALQRSADLAAIAGALRAASSQSGVPTGCSGATNASACAQAYAAADLADVDTSAGSATRTWNGATKTLTDGSTTVAIVAGVRTASDVAVSVSISRALPAIFAYPVDGQANYTVSASAIAEVFAGGTTGTQPCMTALSGYGQGVTSQIDVSVSGNANLTMNGCTMRSNERITLSGNVNLIAAAIYANSTISISGNAHITGTQYPNSGQIPDPYASNSAVQAAFANLTTQTTRTFSGGGAVSPGTYASMNMTSNTQMAAGLYTVTGNLSMSGNTAVTGSGVTFVVGGSVSITGSVNFNVTAPGTSPTGGAISGMLIADNGTTGETVSGNASSAISGVLYFPNSVMTFGGNGATNGVSTCLEVIASSVVITGNTNMGGNCSQMGATSFGSMPAAATVKLVQ